MTRLNKPFSFPLPRRRARQARSRASRGRGVAFLILMMVLTILLISLTVAAPDIYTVGQREREEELIFRGNEYARAIMLYHRQFNRFPTSVKDLIKKTNGYRFLRHAYPDPMTRSGKWRFIHANAAWVVIDSKTLTPPAVKKPGEQVPGAGGQGTGQSASPGGQGFHLSSLDSSGGVSQGTAQVSTPGGEASQQSSTSPSNQEVKGAFIVGVASTSTKRSIRVWNNHDRYDEWEFLGIGNAATGAGTVQPGTPSSSGKAGPQLPGAGMGPSLPSNPQH
jgi:type II secretory pathway pseudopilin PulG